MTTLLATITAFTVFVFGIAPLAFAYFQPKAAAPVALLYSAALAALAVYHSGVSIDEVGAAPDPKTASTVTASSEELEETCGKAVDLAEQGGVITDRSDPSKVVVAENLWQQLPDMARQALTMCLRQESSAEIEVVPE